MLALAANQVAFTAVVVGVAALGIATALFMALRRPDGFGRAGGRFWIYHGETDTSPHQMPGVRFEERHVIDPPLDRGRDRSS